MSTDNDKKNDQVGGDWDTALEEWDESPLVPALADDKTPAPPAASTPIPSSSTAEAADRGEGEARHAVPTVRPPEAPPITEDEEDEECTVVGEIPPELLADSVRGLGSASGLGQIFSRGSQPTIPADEEAEEDDSQVFTSAPKVGKSETPSAPPPAKPAVIREEVSDEGMFDPFADLRDEIDPSHEPEKAKPAADTPVPIPADVTPLPGADATPVPSDEVPVPSVDAEDLAEGPKLLEPGERQYPQDEVTEVFASDEAVDRLVERGAVRSNSEAHAASPRSVPPPPPSPAKPQWPDERDAVTHLLERDLRSSWEARASWLAEEAAERETSRNAQEFCSRSPK